MDLPTWVTVLWKIIMAIIVIHGAQRAIQDYTGWFIAWNRAGSLAILQKRRDRLIRLHDSDREYYGWLLSGALWVLMLLALALVLEGLTVFPTFPPQLQLLIQDVIKIGRFGLGMTATIIAIGRLGDYHQLQHFDRSIMFLDHMIAKLAAKKSQQPAPSAK